MSREVRRVPLGWKHPVRLDPYWRVQASTPYGRNRPASRLHSSTERFTPLYGTSFTPAHEEWERERSEWEAGDHDTLRFTLRYHSADGYLNRSGTRDEPRPYKVYDGDTLVREFFPTTVEDILAVYPYGEYATEPTPETHMPDFDVPADELGWCLYETVSEGTPVTPVFATTEELIEHLATIGMDHDQQPMRRTAAEALVNAGFSVGTFVTVGNVLYDGAKDLDRIQALPRDRQAPA